MLLNSYLLLIYLFIFFLFLHIKYTNKLLGMYPMRRVSILLLSTVVSHIYTYDRAQNILNFVQPLQNLIL